MKKIEEKISIEIGKALIPVIGAGTKIKEKANNLRKKFLEEEVKIPWIHLYDNPTIEPLNGYRILINEKVMVEKTLKVTQEEKKEQFEKSIDKLMESIEETIWEMMVHKKIKRGEGVDDRQSRTE